jgi:hypothetical protein
MMKVAGAEAVKAIIDKAMTPHPVDEDKEISKDKKKIKQTAILFRIADEQYGHEDNAAADERGSRLFHNAEGVCYTDLEIRGHRETWPIRSRQFKGWLTRQYYEETNSTPSSEAMSSALNLIEAKAQFDAPVREVFIRIADHDGRIYLDLCNEKWQAVEIGTNGWRVIDQPPVRFIRRRGMRELPRPIVNTSIALLRPYLNVSSDAEFVLTVSWQLAALRGHGPYPVLALVGESGTAKSTLLEFLRSCIDPNTVPLRAPPRDDRELFIAACNSHIPTYDNLSELPEWLSDTFARLATGGGFAVRMLYTDDEERLFTATRPILLGSIANVVIRGDLADRTIFLKLNTIAKNKRRLERELWAAFERDLPRILGALLHGVAHGLRELPNIKLEGFPRMADFAEWGAACEGAYWESGTFSAAYDGNRDEAVGDIIEADLVATAVQSFMVDQEEWSGETMQLLTLLEKQIDEKQMKSRQWPKAANTLSNKLRRAASDLRKIGIEITEGRDPTTRRKVWTITQKQDPTRAEKHPSDPSILRSGDFSMGSDPKDTRRITDPPKDRQNAPKDRSRGSFRSFTSFRPNPLKNHRSEGSKDPKDDLHTQSGSAPAKPRPPFQYRVNVRAREKRVRETFESKQRAERAKVVRKARASSRASSL